MDESRKHMHAVSSTTDAWRGSWSFFVFFQQPTNGTDVESFGSSPTSEHSTAAPNGWERARSKEGNLQKRTVLALEKRRYQMKCCRFISGRNHIHVVLQMFVPAILLLY